jgi:hypothetical protein
MLVGLRKSLRHYPTLAALIAAQAIACGSDPVNGGHPTARDGAAAGTRGEEGGASDTARGGGVSGRVSLAGRSNGDLDDGNHVPRGTGGTLPFPSGDAGSAGDHGGEGGEPLGGTGGSSGIAGIAGEPGEAGAVSGGAGGTGASGGTGAAGAGGEDCGTCGADACSSAIARCGESSVCSAWFDCVSGCSDATCARACDESHRDAVLLTMPVYQCLCGACSEACSAFDTCSQRCEEGDAPPQPTSTPPAALSDTGLYVQALDGTWQLAPYVRSFRPEYTLFSDNSAKERFIYLPRCSTIDTIDMDHWVFPVGTRVWKQFTRDGIRIETRMLSKYGPADEDWLMVSFQWPLSASQGVPDPTLAFLPPAWGVADVNGTAADIPSIGDCQNCHEHIADRVLGFSAIQLSHSLGGVTFADLVDFGVLSDAPVREGYDPPGDATTQSALGYLHANCGGCHNEDGVKVSIHLRLLVGDTTVESTGAYSTTVNVPTENPVFPMDRIEPGDPSTSALIQRMLRTPDQTNQMPPLARELVDDVGVTQVSTWITQLPP